MRIVATKFAIEKMIYSIGSPRHSVFTQPRPIADLGKHFIVPWLSGFRSLFQQLDTTRCEVVAHKINMDLQGKEQLRVPHRNTKDVGCPIHALDFGLEERDLRVCDLLMQARFNLSQTAIQRTQTMFHKPSVNSRRVAEDRQ